MDILYCSCSVLLTGSGSSVDKFSIGSQLKDIKKLLPKKSVSLIPRRQSSVSCVSVLNNQNRKSLTKLEAVASSSLTEQRDEPSAVVKSSPSVPLLPGYKRNDKNILIVKKKRSPPDSRIQHPHRNSKNPKGALEDLVSELMARGRYIDVSDTLDSYQLSAKKLTTVLKLMRKKRAPAHCYSKVFDWASSPSTPITLNVIHYNSLMSALGRTSLSQAEEVYLRMRQHGVRPDLYSFNSLLNSCARQGNWQQALHFHYHLKTLGLVPDVFTFNTLMSALERGGRWKHALQVRDEMIKGGVLPDVVTFSTLFRACERGKQWDLAFELYEEMQAAGVKPNKYTFTTLISSCQGCARWEAAVGLLSDMEAAGVAPNVVTFSALISVCAEARQAHEATRLWDLMKDSGVKPNTFAFNALISAHQKAGDWEQAIRVYREMQSEVAVDFVTATTLIKAIKQGLPEQGGGLEDLKTLERSSRRLMDKFKTNDSVMYRESELRRPVQERLDLQVEELLSLAVNVGFWPVDLI